MDHSSVLIVYQPKFLSLSSCHCHGLHTLILSYAKPALPTVSEGPPLNDLYHPS